MAAWPFPAIRSRRILRVEIVEEPELASSSIVLFRLAGLDRAAARRELIAQQAGPAIVEAIECTGPDQRLDAPGATSRVGTRSKKSSRLMNGPLLVPRFTIASTALNPTPLMAPRPKWIVPLLRHAKVEISLVDIRFQDFNPETAAILDVFDEELVALGTVHFRREHGGHVLGRVMGLEICGLKSDQSVSRAMRLVEAIAAEVDDQVEDLGRFLALEALGHRPFKNWSRLWAITSAFFFEIALMVAYACESSMPPRRFMIRMTCS